MKFTELSQDAKDHAVQKYNETSNGLEWWDSVYANATEDGVERGFNIARIGFSGFYSQGDGANWSGFVRLGTFLDYHLKDANPDYTRYVVMRELIRNCNVENYIKVRHSGRYEHSGCMSLDDIEQVYIDPGKTIVAPSVLEGADVLTLCEAVEADKLIDALHKWAEQAARDYADKIYEDLEAEYEHLTSEGAFVETADANDWDFDENGDII